MWVLLARDHPPRLTVHRPDHAHVPGTPSGHEARTGPAHRFGLCRHRGPMRQNDLLPNHLPGDERGRTLEHRLILGRVGQVTRDG